MNRNSFYISFGVWLVILPFLGVPGIWKNNLVLASGIFSMLVCLGPDILKKLQAKAKSKKKQSKTNSSDMFSQNNNLRFSSPENNPIKTETKEEV